MKVLGVTGGTGTGKTTVCEILKDLGGHIIDSDEIVRRHESKGKDAYNEIVQVYGPDILKADGELDRKKLADIVFSNEEERIKLNSIVHKYVSEEIYRRVRAYKLLEEGQTKFIVLDVPIPIEEGFFDTCDYVWAVVANDDIRVARLRERMGISEEEAMKRISAQMSNHEYADIADCTIENEGTRDALEKLVKFELRRMLGV